jgi:hypothetical protein
MPHKIFMIKKFFENKKLKRTNALELVPVALVTFETVEESQIQLLVPRFKQKWLQNIFLGKRKSPDFRVKLDVLGSQVWRLINNERSVEEIIQISIDTHSANSSSFENAEGRITAFITDLYRKDLITFKNLG